MLQVAGSIPVTATREQSYANGIAGGRGGSREPPKLPSVDKRVVFTAKRRPAENHTLQVRVLYVVLIPRQISPSGKSAV